MSRHRHFFLLATSVIAGLLFAPAADIHGQQVRVQRVTNAETAKELANAVRADLKDSVRIADAELQVAVRDGILTLSGTVRSMMDRQRAVEIAKRTRGIKAVVDQLVVTRSDRSDEDILADVEKVLRINDSVDHPRITAKVEDSVVWLAGAVNSLSEVRIAKMAAGGVRGVTDLKSQITIRPKVQRTDREIRDEIAGLLVHSIYLDDVLLDIEVKDGVVHLEGTVGSVQQREHAARMSEIRGVVSVDTSKMDVDSSKLDPTERQRRYANVNDETISQAVDRVLDADPIVFQSAKMIERKVNRGVVTLTGETKSLAAKRKAERLASDVVGVARVVNELEVRRPSKEISDAEIIDTVQDSIRRSAYLDRREVRVHCQRAHVSIYGVVESELEKQVAGWLADNVAGVVHVNNRLAVEKEWTPKPDKDIKRDLERKLKYSLLDRANQIDVTVENGVVILRGDVATWRQWQLAMDLALEAGGKHPHNLINVRYHPPHGGSRVYVGY